MKRHPDLRPLSREHHLALAEARAIRWALAGRAGTAREARASFLAAWRSLIEDHFAAEERWILPLVPRREDAQRLREEHALLRGLAERLALGGSDVEPDPELLASLARALDDHIRWEERYLFPSIEAGAAPAALAEAGEALARIGERRRS